MKRPRFNHQFAQRAAEDALTLHKISFKVISATWAQVVVMMMDANVEPQIVLEALKEGHGIEIAPDENPTLWFVLDSEMRDKLHDANYREPTTFQLIATSRCVGLSEEDAKAKFTAMVRGDN